jgi:hypothetical protein
MRLKRPTRATIDQVRITREGNDAIIDYADPSLREHVSLSDLTSRP